MREHLEQLKFAEFTNPVKALSDLKSCAHWPKIGPKSEKSLNDRKHALKPLVPKPGEMITTPLTPLTPKSDDEPREIFTTPLTPLTPLITMPIMPLTCVGQTMAGMMQDYFVPKPGEVMPIEYEDNDDAEIMVADEEVEIEVAADSGSVDHIAHPSNLPRSVKLRRPANGKTRNFVSASNDPIKNYGEARVRLRTEEGKTVGNIFQAAEVCRPLHSVSKTCDAGHEMLFMKGEAIVVPEGTFSKLIGSVTPIARYRRKGGLYVAKMTVLRAADADESDFVRPGADQ